MIREGFDTSHAPTENLLVVRAQRWEEGTPPSVGRQNPIASQNQ